MILAENNRIGKWF